MTSHSDSRSRVLVMGGGLAGTLAAAAVASHCDEVVIVERHTLPDTPVPRRGLPQARHAHMLWSGGADAIEDLLPGTLGLWLDAGAHRIPLPSGMLSYSPCGWYRRWHEPRYAVDDLYLIGASRDLIDWGVRTRLQADPRIRILTAEPLRLLGDRTRITGAVVQHGPGRQERLHADLVIDAMGRSSRATGWLGDIGVPAIPETTLDAGVTYASRRYKAPAGASGDWPAVTIQPDARIPVPGTAGSIIPIEGGTWQVALCGTRGGEPTGDPERFEEYARHMRHSLVADFLAAAEPDSPVSLTRDTASRHRHYGKIRMPAGFLAIGDAATALNPLYGHGMSVAALGARGLRDVASAMGGITGPRFTRRAQREMGRPAAAAWRLAAGQDTFFTGTRGRRPTLADRVSRAYTHRLIRTAASNFTVAEALTRVMSLQAGAGVLAHPRVLLGAIRGPLLPPLTGPPLTAEEDAVKQSPSISNLRCS
ncbi:NAD(P)/FAD-dependent oxidoreductase [Streptomyces sp. NPDC048337]|uniref:NAD(P)/FAD-dependent oxidoreductase n=1 Tax=Streptomyces sp. NPDC048337 TaxID=3365535 RepID=UPI00371AF9C2